MIGPELFSLLMTLGFITMFLLWSREREKSRDYATDLSKVIHDYELDSRDLRRSLRWQEIRSEVEKQYDDEIMGWIDEYSGRKLE